MLVRELINRLETRGLLDHEIIEALRQQLEESGARVTPEAVAKLLVDNGHLTRFQASKLIGELREGEVDPRAGAPAARRADAGADDLFLADEPPSGSDDDDANRVATAIVIDDDDDPVDVVTLDDDDVAEAVEVEEGEMVAEAVAIEDMAALAPHPVVPVERYAKSNKNVWDSIWIYGIGGLIVLLLFGGWALTYVLNRTSAEDFIANGNKAYEGANYVAARDTYRDFLDAYPYDKNVSAARVRAGIAEIVIAKDSVGDPAVGLTKAREILPTIENEDAFGEDREDVAGVLVDIGAEIAAKADSAKTADEKEATLSQLDDWNELVDNPMYLTSTLRQSFGPRLTGIQETRARVDRDIRRDRQLAESLRQMRTALDQSQTKQAYDVRTELIRAYPRLASHAELQKLVLEASGIQKELVKPATDIPSVVTEPVEGSEIQSILLDNRTGSGAPNLVGRVVYFRVRGSVLALKADTGEILWRRYVGYDNENPPVSLGEAPSAGVLLSDGRAGELQRVADNQVEWRSQIGESFSRPLVDGETVYTSTASGRVLALDAMTASARWGQQIPQPLQVSPGIMPRGKFLYQPAVHSNLYVLTSNNGQCVQSYYLGHDLETVKVPAVPLLGHVFVIENRGTNYCLVHVLSINEETGAVARAQDPFRLNGNVTATPEVQGRRMIVLTDLGQISVFDVEPTAEGKKVNIVAEQVATYSSPNDAQMVAGRNEMWVTGGNIGRYDLQISTAKVVRGWIRNEGDTFIARPILMDGTLIHARRLRGTLGVRITAARGEDGAILWQNDVGVPTALLATHAGSGKTYAATSQAALYELNRDAVSTGTTSGPVENPGGEGVSLRFENPLDAGDGRHVLLNQTSSEQLLVFDPNRDREKLRLITLSLPRGRAEHGVLMAGGLVMPMNNGRIMMMNWQSGAPLGSPFQPPSKPGELVQWTSPVASPSDPEQLLIGDSRGKLYRLRVGEQIRELTSVDIATSFVGPAAAVGGNWIAAVTGAAGDTLVTYNATSLEETSQRMMGERITFGPVATGDVALIQTADNKIHRIDGDAKILWSLELPGGQPAAAPLMVDGHLLITGAEGWILKVDPSNGDELGRVEIGQPLSGNPLVGGDTSLLVPGSEGIVFIVARP